MASALAAARTDALKIPEHAILAVQSSPTTSSKHLPLILARSAPNSTNSQNYLACTSHRAHRGNTSTGTQPANAPLRHPVYFIGTDDYVHTSACSLKSSPETTQSHTLPSPPWFSRYRPQTAPFRSRRLISSRFASHPHPSPHFPLMPGKFRGYARQQKHEVSLRHYSRHAAC